MQVFNLNRVEFKFNFSCFSENLHVFSMLSVQLEIDPVQLQNGSGLSNQNKKLKFYLKVSRYKFKAIFCRP